MLINFFKYKIGLNVFNPAILSVDEANQFPRSNKAALCRTKENILCLVLIFGDCLRF